MKVQILVPSYTTWNLKLHLPHSRKVFRLLGLLGYFYMTLSFGPCFYFHPTLHYRIISTQFQQNQYTPKHLCFVTDIFTGKKILLSESCSAGRKAWSEELLLSMPQPLYSIEHLLLKPNKMVLFLLHKTGFSEVIKDVLDDYYFQWLIPQVCFKTQS